MSSAASTAPDEFPPGSGVGHRRPLSVVPRRAGGRSRVSTGVMCALALAAALVGILLLNIQITQGQYELTDLTGQERALSQENEALTQDIEANSAPQNLAARANDLGMVSAKEVGSVDLASGSVTAPSAVAEKTDSQNILVPPAKMKGSDAAEKNRAAAEERAEKRAKEEADKKTAEREAAQKADDARDLNGGSIPAPSQRAPGQ
ncbi:hypothetical protein KVA01_13770 [Kocuria varians]|uniref:Cell division protein FtsL n=1 Tax=Kocuria varians TaxID=1272 RepID=A0A4Y4D4G6_KOCVA|nr:hypothetical protein [Kocuria varians]GEC99222.1 hypothetical protein KVA01_13770 [Kocuria varians]